MLRRWKAGFVMGNYYRQEDISSALSELMESPYANSEPFLYSLGVKDCLKLVKDMVDGKVSDSLKIHVADARENVRGEWEKGWNCEESPDYVFKAWQCSVCGSFTDEDLDYEPRYKYCPWCGADMAGHYDDQAV